jgi:hypothetical protein
MERVCHVDRRCRSRQRAFDAAIILPSACNSVHDLASQQIQYRNDFHACFSDKSAFAGALHGNVL